MVRLGRQGWLWVFVILVLLGAYSAVQSAITQLVLMHRGQIYWPAIGYNFLLSGLIVLKISEPWLITEEEQAFVYRRDLFPAGVQGSAMMSL